MSALPTPCLLLFSRHQTKLHLTNPKEGADENAVSLMTFPERNKKSQPKLPAFTHSQQYSTRKDDGMQINGVKQGYVHYRLFEDVQTNSRFQWCTIS